MKYTKQDYQNALEIYNVSSGLKNIEISFPKYIKAKLSELEQPKTPLYRCIQTPPHRDFYFKVDDLYNKYSLPNWFNLSDLPNHFELVEPEPEPEPEKITWQEVKALIQDVGVSCGHLAPDSVCSKLKNILRRIKKDHLS